jgi:hypothetical protein
MEIIVMSTIEMRQPIIGPGVRTLRDDEMEAVNGAKAGSWFEALAKALGDVLSEQAAKLTN